MDRVQAVVVVKERHWLHDKLEVCKYAEKSSTEKAASKVSHFRVRFLLTEVFLLLHRTAIAHTSVLPSMAN